MSTYEKATEILDGIIAALKLHIKAARDGLIEEPCIMCREKDLNDYQTIQRALEGLKDANEELTDTVKRLKRVIFDNYGQRPFNCWHSFLGDLDFEPRNVIFCRYHLPNWDPAIECPKCPYFEPKQEVKK